MTDNCFLIFGGGGLVGFQVARRIADELAPDRIVIASLYAREVREALAELRRMFGHTSIQFEGVSGNIFVRELLREQPRGELLESYTHREDLYQDLFGPVGEAYERSRMVQLIQQYRPDVIVDCINTATAISYQDTYTASAIAKRELDELLCKVAEKDAEGAAIVLEDRRRES